MDLTFQPILGLAATVVLAFALRTFHHPLIRKAGAVLILVASYCSGLLLLKSHLGGIAAVVSWFLFPWFELLTRIRRLRMPIHKELSHVSPPSAMRFPELAGLTTEIEAEGFEYVDDTGWVWEGMNQFYRLFYHESRRTEAAICLAEQNELGLSYVSLTSRHEDGTILRTWNYPFSETMAMSPRVQINPAPMAASFEELLDLHEQFLISKRIDSSALPKLAPEEIPAAIASEIRDQVDHNLSRGLISPTGDDTFRYSWRGLVFLWAQFVKDMVRLS
jgi:hypothetical protein